MSGNLEENMLFGYAMLFLGIAIYMGCFLAIPLIISKEYKCTKKKINLIVFLNSIAVFIVLTLAQTYIPTTIVMGLICVPIARKILISKCLTENIPFGYPKQTETPIVSAPIEVETRPVSTIQPNYSEQKSCNTYNKKKGNGLVIVIIVLSVLVVGLGTLNIVQFISANVYKEQIAELETELENAGDTYIVENNNEEYLEYWQKNHNKLDFYDANIVFVIDGYGDYYYTYDQMEIVTQGIDEYSYWAYNKEQAIYLGYKAWK